MGACRYRELADYLNRGRGTRNRAGTDFNLLATQEGTGLGIIWGNKSKETNLSRHCAAREV